ncbi:MAG TPA: bifunctional nuclease domain-containing protein [Ktedonobacteraceae bacterium]|nr:bifunctional nuclease domain-containing protein [Ktedonobacteraceae bacterium]
MEDSENLTDAALVGLARTGDRHAFGQLIERHVQMVRQIARGMIANEEIARELAQEALLQAYLSLDHLRDASRFKSWLYGITLNVCRTYIRERKIDPYSLDAIMGGMSHDISCLSLEAVDPEEIAEEHELHRMVLDAVQSLSPKERVATLLFYYEQLSIQEIATILGISIVAVKGRLFKSRKQLRERLLPLLGDMGNDGSKTGKRIPRASIQRGKRMVTVTIVAVLDNFANPSNRVVVLWDEASNRVLNIWIGATEGRIITMALAQVESPRPMTPHFMVNLLHAANIELEAVHIETLTAEVFYATARFRNGDQSIELDVRPSDALALAALLNRPITVAEEVMEKASFPVPEGKSVQPEKFREAARKQIEEEGSMSTLRVPSWPSISPEELEQSLQKFMMLITGE